MNNEQQNIRSTCLYKVTPNNYAPVQLNCKHDGVSGRIMFESAAFFYFYAESHTKSGMETRYKQTENIQRQISKSVFRKEIILLM